MSDIQDKTGRSLSLSSYETFKNCKMKRIGALLFLLIAIAVGVIAFIKTNTLPLTNEFIPAKMSCEVIEDFSSGTEKKNVSIQNTSDTAAYIRVKLLPYWYDKENNTIIAKSSWIPSFAYDSGWILGLDGYWYYTLPVDPDECTSVLIPSLTLVQDNVSFSRQVLEIIASCIQAEPDKVVMEAWSGTNGSVTGVSNNILIIDDGR